MRIFPQLQQHGETRDIRCLGVAAVSLLALMVLPALAAPAGVPRGRPQAAAPIRNPPLAKQSSAIRNASAPRPAPVRFNQDIRPILSDNCFACHGPDRNTRMANLRLDIRADAVARGAVVPGKPEKSSLVARVFAEGGRIMPPVSFHKRLTPEQKNLLKRWVAEGAKYEAHWAFIPPRRPAVPNLTDPRYPVRNPIDAFVRARLVEKRILPSPEADQRMLLRRVYLDLTGLPPTPEEVQAFLADTSPDAYEKVVDRLLASPRYGERMAVPWLDVVRYADTVGFHGDQNQNAWPYRDYVIDSFNRNKPFDQFTVEQIAGDLLPNPTPEQQTATCFNRLTMMTREGGAQPKEYLAKYAGDRVRTVGMAWMGATMGCAECHDHKYDPILQKDFYSLAAFFADVKQWGVYADYSYTPNPDLRGYNNDYPFPPEIKVESRYLKERMDRMRAQIAKLAGETGAGLQNDPAARAAFGAWREAGAAFLRRHPDGWETPAPAVEVHPASPKPGAKPAATPAETKVAAHRVEADGSVLLTDRTPADLEVRLRPETAWVASLRVEVLPSPENGNSIFRQGVEAATLTLSAAVRRAAGKSQAVTFRHAGANIAEPRYRNGFEIVGVHGGWKLSSTRRSEPHVSAWLPAAPFRLAEGEQLTVTFPNIQAGRVRVSVSPFVPEDPDSAALPSDLRSSMEPAESSDANTLALRAYLFGTGWNTEAFTRAKAMEAEIFACRDGITPVLATEATKPLVTRVLPRGNWQDESGPVVQPNVPHFLPGYQADPGRRLSRLDLAKWLVSPENPLTARVFVNRLWKQYFGNGLSAQVEDLGAQGEPPTHPELLDWLAVEFRESGWNVKHMVRLLVTSAAYRQSSNLRPELQSLDPNNRLLASQNPRRLEAEFIRDNALAVVGLLNRDLGGPPSKPYQPADYYENIQFPDRDYIPDPDERQWRRGVYTHWQRTFLHPMLVNFDAPSREDCIAARTVANTPQQALTLLNDPSFVEAARVFAASLISDSAGGDAGRLDRAYERALGRPAKAREKESLLAFLGKMRAAYQERPEDAKKLLAIGMAPATAGADPVELAAWTSVCRVILNLNETITRY
jgi:uncharacterized protein DUF1553/uncharacterized protein DUF1549/cytochrome c